MPSSAIYVVMATLLIALAAPCSAAPHYEDDIKSVMEARDAAVLHEVTSLLMQMIRAKENSPICHHKRNSEIINSLLGLPKTMTDAGRK